MTRARNNPVHNYCVSIEWTGNRGDGTVHYSAYDRDHVISIEGKPDISASSDPAFRGNKARHNPEDLLVASLASCHMLWYLHLCADAGVVVLDYRDEATGHMERAADGRMRFTSVVLTPRVVIDARCSGEQAKVLHQAAHDACFIANSVNFPVTCEPQIVQE